MDEAPENHRSLEKALDPLRVRVVSKRKGGLGPAAGELVISIDRSNPVLGNPHVLLDHRDSKARDRVVAAYSVDLDRDFEEHGPKFLACARIAAEVKAGKLVALACWCKMPGRDVPCHGDHILEKVLSLATVSGK